MFSNQRVFMVSADKIFTEQQLNKFLKQLKASKDRSLLVVKNSKKSHPGDIRNILDYYLFYLIAYTGLRISEALTLEWKDVHEEFLVIRQENSKNGKKGTVYYGPKTLKLLSEFKGIDWNQFKRIRSSALVFSINGGLLSRSYCHTRFKNWLAYCGLPSNLSIHSLRHTYGTVCLDSGLSLTFVRDQLRHSNISITSQYLHLTKANRDKVKDLF